MADYTVLLGAEDVQRAGHNMKDAAEEMTRAANQISEALQRHADQTEQFLRDFTEQVDRLAKIAEKKI